MCGRSPKPLDAAIGNCAALFSRGSQNRPAPCISRLATDAFQCGTDPHPVQVCRLTPPRPNAGGISVAPGTFVRVPTPLLICCGLKALPSRISSESNFPGTQSPRKVHLVALIHPAL